MLPQTYNLYLNMRYSDPDGSDPVWSAGLSGYLRADWQRRQSSRAQPGHVLSPEEEELEHRQLMEFNRAENARMAAEREAR